MPPDRTPKIRPKLSKQARELLQTTRDEYLKEVAKVRATVRSAIDAIAAKYHKAPQAVMAQSFTGSNIRNQTREKSLFNAIVHDLYEKKKANGEEVKGKAMLAKISAEAAAINRENLSKEEKDRLLKNLKQSSKPKLVPKKNAAQDIGHVYEHTKTELDGVAKRTGCHYLLMITRDNVKDDYTTRVSTTKRMQDSCLHAFKSTPDDMTMRLDAAITGGLTGVAKSISGATRMKRHIEFCRAFAYESLCNILTSKGHGDDLPAQMTWSASRYEKFIVCKYGVELRGWTEPGPIYNPGNFKNTHQAERLELAMKNKTCRWVELSEEEWDTRKKVLEDRVLNGGTEGTENGTGRRNEENDTGESPTSPTTPITGMTGPEAPPATPTAPATSSITAPIQPGTSFGIQDTSLFNLSGTHSFDVTDMGPMPGPSSIFNGIQFGEPQPSSLAYNVFGSGNVENWVAGGDVTFGTSGQSSIY